MIRLLFAAAVAATTAAATPATASPGTASPGTAVRGAAPPPDSLSRAEKALVAQVDARTAAALALLQKIVDINSGTRNLAGVRAVGDVLAEQFRALGFTTRWEDGAAWHRAGHLIAEHPGRGPRILLIGHLDTVFEPDSPFQRFERLDDSTARGPGIIDMKGGDVIMLQALGALQARGLLADMNVAVVLHGDEEDPGEGIALARHTLIEEGKKAQVAIGFEDGDGDPRSLVAARRGTASWRLVVHGTPAHSSQIFRADIGPGAIYETARVLDGFRTRLGGDPLVTFNPGVAIGGTAAALDPSGIRGTASGKTNVVAEQMVVTGDLRTISPDALARAKRIMQEVAAASLPHTTSTLTFEDGYPGMAPTDGNRRLLAMLDAASRAIGAGPVGMDDPAKAGAADISFVAGTVPMAVDALGLGGTDDHTAKETADLRWLPIQAKRVALVLHRLSRPGAI